MRCDLSLRNRRARKRLVASDTIGHTGVIMAESVISSSRSIPSCTLGKEDLVRLANLITRIGEEIGAEPQFSLKAEEMEIETADLAWTLDTEVLPARIDSVNMSVWKSRGPRVRLSLNRGKDFSSSSIAGNDKGWVYGTQQQIQEVLARNKNRHAVFHMPFGGLGSHLISVVAVLLAITEGARWLKRFCPQCWQSIDPDARVVLLQLIAWAGYIFLVWKLPQWFPYVVIEVKERPPLVSVRDVLRALLVALIISALADLGSIFLPGA